MKYHHTSDDGHSAFFGKAIFIDAKKRNEENFANWTAEQCAAAAELQKRVGAAYSPKEVYINYRKKFIAVNACNPNPCVTQQAAIKKLLKELGDTVEIIQTATHLVFRMFKKV